ncbi:MAG: hypothetical protein A2Y95_08970 [Deltaproteobacteria bacterium RBG_13_65_10]|nr:MAG: hypothetical protein A2Y95_08970 [Deltaproteobacteria bacterium RBG_13_65_10]
MRTALAVMALWALLGPGARPDSVARAEVPSRPAKVAPEIRWRAWGPDALRESRKARRPLLLFITTPWCHLCRVMEATTFADAGVRALVDATVIPVRLDGERRPDLNERYNLGGWPTTIYLIENGEPLLYPREEETQPGAPPGAPGKILIAKVGSTFLATGDLKALLLATAKYFRENRQGLEKLYARIETVREGEERPAGDLVAPDAAAAKAQAKKIADALYADFDPERGGFADAPLFSEKFPFPEGLEFAMARGAAGDARFGVAAEAIVRALLRGALHDRLRGGFHRYSASRDWMEPHFEKLLGVNAALLHALAQATALPEAGEEARVAAGETLDWMRATLAIPGSPLLASGQDAQTTRSEGRFVEGAYYTWTRAELDRALSAMPEGDRRIVRAAFGLSEPVEPGTQADRRPLFLAQDEADLAARLAVPPARVRAALARGRALLVRARAEGRAPEVFRTAYTDANAQAASALFAAGAALGRADADAMALAITERLWKKRWVKDRGLRHEAGQGGVPAGGLLRDHVAMLTALLDAYEATGERAHLSRAASVAAVMEKRFLDARRGIYLDVAPARPGPGVPRPLTRGRAIVDENAAAALALLRLADHTGRLEPRARAGTLLAWCDTQAASYGRFAARLGLALERIHRPPLTLAVWARPGDPARTRLLTAARAPLNRATIVRPLDPAKEAATLSKLGAQTAPETSILVCRDHRCAAPIRPGGDLRAAVRRAAASFAP